jgi:hypothetical protein
MTTLHIDPERVVHETIDGETLLIHLASGTYFSLRESGVEIWELLVAEGSVERAAAALAERHPTQATQVVAEVQRLAQELVDHDLLVTGPGPAAPAPSPRSAAQRQAVILPAVLEKYTDMQYFLMLDPIHEVDDAAGWPTPAPATGPPTTV